MMEMKYFVLKPKSKNMDDPYARAARLAMLEFARAIKPVDKLLTESLKAWALEEERKASLL